VFGVELKTGVHKKISYQYQVALYSLLLREAYTNASVNNLLVYLHDAENSQMIYWSHKTLSKILQYRNKLVDRIVHPWKKKEIEESKDKTKPKKDEIEEVINYCDRFSIF